MQRARPRSFASPLLTLAALAAVAGFSWNLWYFRDYLIDDSFISLRYARNLAEGIGPVFNPGEYVEGYSNPSWVLLTSLCFGAGLDPIWFARIVSLVSGVAVVILVRSLESIGPRFEGRSLAPVFVVTGPALAYWSVAAFETVPFSAIFLAAIWLLWREGSTGSGHASAVLWIALTWTRPEAPYLFGVATAAFAIADIAAGSPVARVARRHGINALSVTVGLATLIGWRLWFYGEVLPNTYYAKVTGGSEQLLTGLKSVGLWAAAYPLHAVAALSLAAFACRSIRSLRAAPYAMAIALIAPAQIVYVILVGGDFMPYYRFLLPTLALCSLLLSWAIAIGAAHLSPRLRALPAAAAIAIALVAAHADDQRMVAFISHRTTSNGIRVGKMLAEELGEGDWIAVNTAGAIPFYSRLPAIDTLGLTDAAIARRETYIVSTGWAGHRRGWGRYVVDRRPKRIFWYNTTGDRTPFYLGDHELADDPYFRFFYRLQSRQLPELDRLAPLARFLGRPFGANPAGAAVVSAQLGFASVVSQGRIPYSTIYERPLQVHFFERDDRLGSLWPEPLPRSADTEALVDAAIRTWRPAPTPPTQDADARRRVEALADRARAAVESGDLGNAKNLLSDAVAINRRVQSPIVYQYVANVAVLSGDPWIAIAAQKEALRLQPDNAVYRRNLLALLSQPYDELTARPPPLTESR